MNISEVCFPWDGHMCGIFLLLDDRKERCIDAIIESLKARGPDSFYETNTSNFIEKKSIKVIQTVLNVRKPSTECMFGKDVEVKLNIPFTLYNGEIYKLNGNLIPEERNDSFLFTKGLEKCVDEYDVITFLSSLKGPYSFAFYEPNKRRIYFGRDRIGRRSLLVDFNETYFALSSVADKKFRFKPVEARGKVFFYDMNSHNIKTMQLHDSIIKVDLRYNSLSLAQHVLTLLKRAVQLRLCKETNNGNRQFAILFSGGLDSSLLLILALTLFEDIYIDLISVCFDEANGFLSNDRKQAIQSFETISSRFEDKAFSKRVRLILVNATKEKVTEHIEKIKSLIVPCKNDTKLDINIATALYFAGKGKGHLYLSPSKDPTLTKDVQATLSDLLFVKQQTNEVQEQTACTCGKLAKAGCLNLLCSSCCQKHQIETKKPCFKHKLSATKLKQNTILTSFYKRKPIISKFEYLVGAEVRSTAKVMLSGLGADEIFCGYSRHRQIYMLEGKDGLRREIKFMIDNLYARNLGRDDRVISDSGREIRYPFLDTNIIDFMLSFVESCEDVQQYFDYNKAREFGDKKTLRIVACLLGFPNLAVCPKRAIQFGTFIDKMKIA